MGRGIGRRNGRRNGLSNGLSNGLGVLAWILVGAGLRFWQLDAKTPWSDEWATLVFSLGHSFETIPLDQLLSLDELLAIARLDDSSLLQGLGNVWRYLMTESTHPPLYFWLSHLWLRFWQAPGELVGLGVARSLSALLGVVGIPAAYGLGYWVMAGSRKAQRHPVGHRVGQRVGMWAAALMALSPFGVYLAQEARHYTLALLWVMASLGFFVMAWRALRENPPTPPLGKGGVVLGWSGVWLWMLVNGLGVATHYFVGLVLASEGLALAGLVLWQWRIRQVAVDSLGQWRRTLVQIAVVAVGALLAALPWLSFWLSIPGDRLTEWISSDGSLLERLLFPLLRVLAWLVSMVMLMPVEQVPVGLALLSGLVLVGAVVWCLPPLVKSLKRQQNSAVEALLAVQGVGLALVLAAIYIWQKDLSLATRYFFVFLPGMVLLGAIGVTGLKDAGLSYCRVMLLALGFAGSLAVTTGYAFQKPDRPDLMVQDIQEFTAQQAVQMPQLSDAPTAIAMFYKTHEQVSELLSLGWEWQRQGQTEGYFLISRRRDSSVFATTRIFSRAMRPLPRPFLLWEANVPTAVDFTMFGCNLGTSDSFTRVPGYRYKAHLCLFRARGRLLMSR